MIRYLLVGIGYTLLLYLLGRTRWGMEGLVLAGIAAGAITAGKHAVFTSILFMIAPLEYALRSKHLDLIGPPILFVTNIALLKIGAWLRKKLCPNGSG